MFIRLSFDIYKPNLEAMHVLLQSDETELDLDRIVKWKEIGGGGGGSVILFVWNCSSLGYKTKPELLKWEIN